MNFSENFQNRHVATKKPHRNIDHIVVNKRINSLQKRIYVSTQPLSLYGAQRKQKSPDYSIEASVIVLFLN
jgi:hypothetical protein